MKGYKVFNSDLTCRDYQFKAGETHVFDGNPVLCEQGFHFCTKASDCFNYYDFNSDNKVYEIQAGGIITDKKEDCSKRACSELTLLKELNWHEVLDLVNTGYWNSGDWNSGYWNSGDWNSGYCNSGNRNSGNRNSGNRNSGNRNSGDWNSGSLENGCFCTNDQDQIFVFNKLCTKEALRKAYKPKFLYFDTLVWVHEEDMTEKEKDKNPDYKVVGGYLKEKQYKEAFKESFEKADKEDRMRIKDFPNFDADIFEEISGIRISDYE